MPLDILVGKMAATGDDTQHEEDPLLAPAPPPPFSREVSLEVGVVGPPEVTDVLYRTTYN